MRILSAARTLNIRILRGARQLEFSADVLEAGYLIGNPNIEGLISEYPRGRRRCGGAGFGRLDRREKSPLFCRWALSCAYPTLRSRVAERLTRDPIQVWGANDMAGDGRIARIPGSQDARATGRRVIV